MNDSDALLPALLIYPPFEERFQPSARRWQGVPSVEVTRQGRMYCAFYGGTEVEASGNYILLLRREQSGDPFVPAAALMHPGAGCRVFDPCLWLDPAGQLRMFWTQSCGFNDGRLGIWSAVCADPDADEPLFSQPFRISDGVMLNKPVILSDGRWLLPAALWQESCRRGKEAEQDSLNRLAESTSSLTNSEKTSFVLESRDEGHSFELIGRADIPQRSFDEPMLFECGDGSLRMLVRTSYGVGESQSHDGGYTWSTGRPSLLPGADSRFFVRRLNSGRLLFISHDPAPSRHGLRSLFFPHQATQAERRSRLCSWLSGDDGKTWSGRLMLDERKGVSYPDAKETPDGVIHCVYDHCRTESGEILLAEFTEEDIFKGRRPEIQVISRLP